MKLNELLNELNRQEGDLSKGTVASLLSGLALSKLDAEDLSLNDSDKISRNLISNTERFTCYSCSVPSGISCEDLKYSYANMTSILVKGKLQIEINQGILNGSYGVTEGRQFRVLSVGDIIEAGELEGGEVVLSNPFEDDSILVCISIKNQLSSRELEYLANSFDGINGIELK